MMLGKSEGTMLERSPSRNAVCDRIVRVLFMSLCAIFGALVWSTSTASAEINGPCSATVEGKDVAGLDTIVSLDDLLEARWARLEEACDGAPSTLVHGDFRPKNAYLRHGGAGVALFPIDWETAGLGIPAADLTRVDVTAYWRVVREWWPGLALQDIQRLATVGQVFQALAAIGWDSPQLAYDTPRFLCRPMACLQVQRKKLSEAVRAAGVAA